MVDLFYYLFVNPFTGVEPHIYPFFSICVMLNIIYAVYLIIDVVRSEAMAEMLEDNGFKYIRVEDGVFTRAVWGYAIAMVLETSALFFGGLIYIFLAPTTQALEEIALSDYLGKLLSVIGIDVFFWIVIFITCAIVAPIIEGVRLKAATRTTR